MNNQNQNALLFNPRVTKNLVTKSRRNIFLKRKFLGKTLSFYIR